jgi:hypothetical protein
MSNPWNSTVTPVADGELVNAEVSGRPIYQLARQARNLKDRVEELSTGSGRLVYENAPLGEGVIVLDVVYFDTSEGKFLPALAEVVLDANGKTVCGPRSLAVGVVISKESAVVGSILQLGRLDFADEGFDPADMIADPITEGFTPGKFYLSQKVPGKITAAPVMPAIQVGFFTDTECSVSVVHKDIFESHHHYRYSLDAKPSASQNYAGTGWTTFGLSSEGDIKAVDYYSEGAEVTPPQIIMCIRHPGGNQIFEDEPARFEIYNDDLGNLAIDRVSGGIDITDPESAGTETLTGSIVWPEYGEWVSAGFDSGLEIAFIRADADYTNSLADDAATLLDSEDKKFRVFLPNDLTGWTNANTFDLTYSSGAIYKYLMAENLELFSVFPPLPLSSAIIELNGSSMVPGIDFDVTLSGVFWRLGTFTPVDYAPWPSDYSVVSPSEMTPENAKNLTLYFIKSGMEALNSVVFSLTGISPIKITRCPSGEDASTGHLQISIDLGLLMSTATPLNSETAISSVSGVSFIKSLSVSELVEGAGIKIDNITDGATIPGKKVGKVRISSRPSRFEGEVYSIALRNAKEMISSFATYIDFIPTAEGSSGITAQFKLPNLDISLAQIKLRVLSRMRGSVAVAEASAVQTGIFKVTYHAMRPSFRMSEMNEGNAIAVQYWTASFPAGYLPSTILSGEIPIDSNDDTAFEINSTTINTDSLVFLSGGFVPGDQIVMVIDRVNEDGDGNIASYPGRIGMTGLRWELR